MKNEIILTESKTMRDNLVGKYYVLDKVKELILLPDKDNMTTEMVADYYDVNIKTINSIIKLHKEELEIDGLQVLKGKDFTHFATLIDKMANDGNYFSPKIRSLTIIPRRVILRIGMLLRDSEVAKQIRTYLLDIENNASMEDRFKALLEDNNRELLTAFTNQNKLLNTKTNTLECKVNNIEEKVNTMSESFIFTRYDNPSYRFNALINRFGNIFDIKHHGRQYKEFYLVFENWMGIRLPKTNNTKQYILNTYNVDIIDKLINAIDIGRIVKSEKGNWVDLNGYKMNDIEFNKIKREFNHKCAYCGLNGQLIPEHIIPQSKEDSTDVIYNIIPACKRCNEDKFNSNPKEWYENSEFYDVERKNKINNHWKKYFVKLSK